MSPFPVEKTWLPTKKKTSWLSREKVSGWLRCTYWLLRMHFFLITHRVKGSWQKFYVMMQNYELHFYNDHKSKDSPGTKPLVVFSLMHCTTSLYTKEKKKNVFQVCFIFSDCMEWCMEIHPATLFCSTIVYSTMHVSSNYNIAYVNAWNCVQQLCNGIFNLEQS